MSGQIGGYSEVVEISGATVGVGATAYAAGDLLGSKLTLTGACLRDGGTTVLMSVTVHDLDKQDAEIDVIIFNADPSGTTFTDNAALDIADADLPKIAGFVTIIASDYADFNDNSVGCVKNIGLACKNGDSTITKDLYACLISRGAPTYSADGLSVSFGFSQD